MFLKDSLGCKPEARAAQGKSPWDPRLCWVTQPRVLAFTRDGWGKPEVQVRQSGAGVFSVRTEAGAPSQGLALQALAAKDMGQQ